MVGGRRKEGREEGRKMASSASLSDFRLSPPSSVRKFQMRYAKKVRQIRKSGDEEKYKKPFLPS